MFTKIEDIKSKELIPGFHVQFVHGNNMTTAFWTVNKGAKLPSHSHVHEQISMVTHGKFEMTIDGKTKIYEPGGIVVIPSNIEHSGTAITDCKITDIFSPVREEYK